MKVIQAEKILSISGSLAIGVVLTLISLLFAPNLVTIIFILFLVMYVSNLGLKYIPKSANMYLIIATICSMILILNNTININLILVYMFSIFMYAVITLNTIQIIKNFKLKN